MDKFLLSDTATLLDAMKAIDANWSEFVLVVNAHQQAVGTVTDGDIRRGLLNSLDFKTPVSQVMQRSFVHVGPDVPRGNVLDIMRARDIKQVPVLDQQGIPIGVHFLRDLIGKTPKPNHAIIMAGGKGSRLLPLTQNRPKPMLPVAGKPILEHLVVHLVGQGIHNIWISLNYLGTMIEEHFHNGEKFGCNIRYLREDKELGTAGSLSLLPEDIQEPVLVMNGDLMTQVDISGLLQCHSNSGASATVCARPHQYEVPFGVIDSENDQLVQLREKPVCDFLVNAGIYALNPEILGLLPHNSPYTMPELLEAAKAHDHLVGVYHMYEEWLDVGRPAELAKARGQL